MRFVSLLVRVFIAAFLVAFLVGREIGAMQRESLPIQEEQVVAEESSISTDPVEGPVLPALNGVEGSHFIFPSQQNLTFSSEQAEGTIHVFLAALFLGFLIVILVVMIIMGFVPIYLARQKRSEERAGQFISSSLR